MGFPRRKRAVSFDDEWKLSNKNKVTKALKIRKIRFPSHIYKMISKLCMSYSQVSDENFFDYLEEMNKDSLTVDIMELTNELKQRNN